MRAFVEENISTPYKGYIIKLNDMNEEILWDAQNHNMTLCSQMVDNNLNSDAGETA